jgi:hypothetical protein
MNIYFTGHVNLESNLSLESLGRQLSVKLFGGIPFQLSSTGRFEEVPTLILSSKILDCEVLLHGQSPYNDYIFFSLSINGPEFRDTSKSKRERIKLNDYLQMWLKKELEDSSDIFLSELQN